MTFSLLDGSHRGLEKIDEEFLMKLQGFEIPFCVSVKIICDWQDVKTFKIF